MAIDVSGDDRIDVVGESYRRDALRRVTRADQGEEPVRRHVATLVPEPTNAYDRNAVKIVIAGEHVGYIPRHLSALLAAPISELAAKHGEVTAIAEINGSDSELGFGVALYLKLQMLNVVIVQEEADLDDRLLISDDAAVSSSTGTLTAPAPRTASEAAQALGVSEETLAARRETVERAVEQWKTDLIDLTARNRLLYLRDLRTGTLSFDEAGRDALMELVVGKRVALSKLVPRSLARKNPAALTPFEDAVRRTRAITRTARAYEEERGIRTLYLACGLATWKSDRATRPPAAPVLLVPIEIRARGASQQDFELSTLGELEINPTLLHLLRVEFRREIDEEELLGHDDMDGAIDTPEELRLAFDWLSEKCAGVPGWAIAERFVLGNFWYAKLPMVRDLESAVHTIASHDLASALAGHAEARDAVLACRAAMARTIPAVDAIDPGAEFNVLDSDSSQSVAIGRALAGEDLVLKGPPGTGKSQTIANLICGAVAAGKRVLFVAEKRAAIEAVTKRLRATGLEHLVLDLHEGAESRKWLAHQLGASLEAIRTVGDSDARGDHGQLIRLRDTLKAHAQELHHAHAPWEVSIYRAQMEVLDRGRPEVTARLRGSDLQAVTAPRLEELIDRLRDLISLDGLSLRHRSSPWAEADVRTIEAVAQVKEDVEAVSGPLLTTMEHALRDAAEATGLPAPTTLAGAERLIELWSGAAACAESFDAGIFDSDLQLIVEALRPLSGGALPRFVASLGSSRFRAARRVVLEHLDEHADSAPAQVFSVLSAAAALQSASNEHAAAKSTPSAPTELAAWSEATVSLRSALTRLSAATSQALLDATFAELRRETSAMQADMPTLAVLPEIHRARAELTAAGLATFLGELEARQDLLGDATNELRRLWWLSLADGLMMRPNEGVSLAAFRGERHEETLASYRELEHRHVATSAQRVRRAAAEAAICAQDDFPEQAQLVRRQASRKRGHLPVRELFLRAPDVVTALRPCWVMSPLMVSQLIPSDRSYFDIVVFDEASQVRPVDALSSMIRGRQLVVAGDERQLPPTAFFDAAATGAEDTNAEDEEASEIGDYESLLEVLMPLLEIEMLRWHYRSRDERLIGFSNREIYDGSLTTFPGAVADEVLCHVLVDEIAGEDESRVSPDAEVRRVVELVLEHATNRPHESLGVIALGIRHADAIEAGLLAAIEEHPHLGAFFDEEREERFFVKNLERVQGDERDAIILAVGYGKNPDGTLPHNFGPLNKAGGERRLNVAVSRAKRRMTVVSSFSADDIDPKRSSRTGVLLLRAFLEYAAGGGVADEMSSVGESTVLHRRIEQTLAGAGHEVLVTPGTSADRLDVAVIDPDVGVPTVAIEIDGPGYAERPSVRDRDRLRPEQLGRLGWQHLPTWSQDWYRDPDAAAARLLDQVAERLETARRGRGEAEAATLEAEPSASGPNGEGANARVRFEPRIRPSKPDFRSGGPAITDWRHDDLVALAAWIETDGLLRTSDELQREMMRELGLSRRGSRVAAALDAAVAALRDAQE
jgi:hypothetical protein